MPALSQSSHRAQQAAQRHAKIVALWDKGLCNSQIAERLGCSKSAVSRVLTKAARTSSTVKRHRYDGIGGEVVLPALAQSDRIVGMVERYSAQYPQITALIRRGYSAERIAELTDCEIWVAKLIKISGRF